MRRLSYLLIALVLVSYVLRYWWQQQPAAYTPSIAPRKRPPPSTVKDSLTVLDGIGPAYERALNAAGIFTFSELAAQDADSLAARLSGVRVTAARIRRDRWIEQAAARSEALVTESRYWSANDGNKT